ncbi:MAG: type IV toxin-antitoxin system AbiEi family antitoxin domain-containing protein [Endozoicomonas sp.]|uniref:type IV toxin-antitoxin system AbiEi family antitoxin domain-containing protein n=1 Tax=Endozoicomonas sp. TaxID=1892382 RepID=UPI003D9BDB05
MRNKINLLLKNWQPGQVASSRWLESQGISRMLVRKYVNSGWLSPVGHGAYIRCGDRVGWPGAVAAIQQQLEKEVWVGGLSALSLHGLVHYLPFGQETLNLYGVQGTQLPKWFSDNEWNVRLCWHTRRLFNESRSTDKKDHGLITLSYSDQKLVVSSAERAVLELLQQVPNTLSFEYAAEIVQGATSLRPRKLQKLLEQCSSVKVKRLLLFIGESYQHQWYSRLDITAIDLGQGKRQVVKGGKLDHKYQITVPNSFKLHQG